MEFKDFTAGINDEGRRFDKVIRKLLPDTPMSALYSAIRKGLIKLNKHKARIETKVENADVISIASFLLENQNQPDKHIQSKKNNDFSQKIEFEKIFQNDDFLVINKPYDVNVHGTNSLSKIIEKDFLENKKDDSLSFVPGPLHRLDRKTTGLLVFSESLKGASWFSKAISEKTIEKYYIGIAEGNICQKEIWEDHIEEAGENKFNYYRMKITDSSEQTLFCKTIVTPLSHGQFQKKEITLCQYQILTGKKHQIRCQSEFHGHSLLGDTVYGGTKMHLSQEYFLHAYKMIFPDENPLALPLSITAEIPENFKNFINLSLIKWDGSLII